MTPEEYARKIIEETMERGWDGTCGPGYPRRIVVSHPLAQRYFDEQYRILCGTIPLEGV